MLLMLLTVKAFAEPLTLAQAAAEARTQGPAAQIVEQELRAERAMAWAGATGQAQAQVALLAGAGWGEWTAQIPVGLLVPVHPGPLRSAQSVAELRAQAGRLALLSSVFSAYLELARTQALSSLYAQVQELASQAARAASARRDAGELAGGAAALLSADAARALDSALRAQREQQLACWQLEALLGREPTGSLLSASWPTLSEAPNISPEQALAVSLAQAEQRAAVAQHNQQRLNSLPMLSAVVGIDQQGDSLAPLWGFNLQAAPPGALAQSRAADAQATMSAALTEQARLDAAVQLRDARLTERLAEEVLRSYEGVPLHLALDESAARFAAGEWSAAETLAARQAATEALQGEIDARAAFAAARWRLWELSGQLPPELR